MDLACAPQCSFLVAACGAVGAIIRRPGSSCLSLCFFQPSVPIVESALRCAQRAPICWKEQSPRSAGRCGGPQKVPCGRCAALCPSSALRLSTCSMTIGQVMEEIQQDRDFYLHSGGGVTLSGGEPLLQPVFCAELAKACCHQGIPVLLDTAGDVPWSSFQQVIPYTRQVYYDVKTACQGGLPPFYWRKLSANFGQPFPAFAGKASGHCPHSSYPGCELGGGYASANRRNASQGWGPRGFLIALSSSWLFQICRFGYGIFLFQLPPS